MRKFKRINNKQFGISVLILSLIITQAGITKIRNAKAEEKEIPQIIVEYQIQEKIRTIPSRSTYIESEKLVNIYPQRPEYDISLPIKYQDLIWQLCLKNDLSYEFVLAVFHYESKFNPQAKNKNKDKSTDVGVSQLNNYYIDTHRGYAIKYCDLPESVNFNMLNPDHNIRAGIGTLVYLRDYWRQKGVSEHYLLEYITGSFNMGVTGFTEYIKRTGKIEREYSRQIKIRKDKLEISNTL